MRRSPLSQFLFDPADPACVAIQRVVLAVLLGFAFWPRGLQPMDAVEQWPVLAGLYEHLFLTLPYRLLMLAGFAGLAAGWRPRIVGLFLLCLLLPHDFLERGRQSRQVLLFSVLFISILPATSLWRWRELRAGQLPAGPMWPIRLLQIQLTLLYGVNAIAKTTPAFLGGDVLAALSTLPNFLVDLTDGHLHVGPLAIPVVLLAIGTVAIEYFLALGFWFRPTRWIAAVVGLTFHLTLKFVLKIFMLDYVSLFLYLPFLLPWDRLTGVNNAVAMTTLRENTNGAAAACATPANCDPPSA